MIMTGGSIIPSSMLEPFYRHIGSFLPSGIPGFMQLVYIGHGIGGSVQNLFLISIVTWGITVLRVTLEENPSASDNTKFEATTTH
jgi:hypothetical protein